MRGVFIILSVFISTKCVYVDGILYGRCFGSGWTMNAACASSERIFPHNVTVGAKNQTSGCPQDIVIGTNSTAETYCCDYASDTCYGTYKNTNTPQETYAYHANCTGRATCKPLAIARAPTTGAVLLCDQTIYYATSTFMVLDYECISDSNIRDFTASVSESNIPSLYLRGQEYSDSVSGISQSVTSRSCSIETSDCDGQVRVVGLDIRLASESGQCKQNLTFNETNHVIDKKCNDNNNFQMDENFYQSNSNYIIMTFSNSLVREDGFIWIKIEPVNNSHTISVNCPPTDENPACIPTTVESTTIDTTVDSTVDMVTDGNVTDGNMTTVQTLNTTINMYPLEEEDNAVVIVVSVVIGGVIIIVIVSVVAVWKYRKYLKNKKEKVERQEKLKSENPAEPISTCSPSSKHESQHTKTPTANHKSLTQFGKTTQNGNEANNNQQDEGNTAAEKSNTLQTDITSVKPKEIDTVTEDGNRLQRHISLMTPTENNTVTVDENRLQPTILPMMTTEKDTVSVYGNRLQPITSSVKQTESNIAIEEGNQPSTSSMVLSNVIINEERKKKKKKKTKKRKQKETLDSLSHTDYAENDDVYPELQPNVNTYEEERKNHKKKKKKKKKKHADENKVHPIDEQWSDILD